MTRLAAIATGLFLATTGVATAATLPKPVATTGGASAVTYQSATLTGTVNPKGSATVYFFQIGVSTKYGGQSAPVAVAPGTSAVTATGLVGGLAPVTTYHYRLIAVNGGGTTPGADRTFTTPKIPLSVGIIAVPNPTVAGGGLTVEGTVSGTGSGNRQVILQANPYPFTAGFQNVGNTALTSAAGGFAFNILSLPVTTQFRVVSIGGGQAIASPVVTEYVALGVTTRITSHKTKARSYTIRFTGTVSPAEAGARVAVQRLVGRTWKFVAGGNAKPGSSAGSPYSVTIHVHHGGFYRVRVLPVEGGHVTGYGPATLVRVAGSL